MIRGVLFDFDGTLTEPGSLDFQQIRDAIGCPRAVPILEFIASLADEAARERARRTLHEFEMEAARRSLPNARSEEILRRLRAAGLKVGILTRNSLAAISAALANFSGLGLADFDVVLTRDDAFPPKPDPDAVLEAARRLELPPGELLAVGDYVFDVEAGRRAGAVTAFLTNRDPEARSAVEPDHIIGRLEEILEILPLHLPLAPGKLPNRLLGRFLEEVGPPSAELLIAPGVGEDVAALNIAGEEVLLLKSDPITFTADSIARYAVAVNANDVATAGARPRWLTATLLFPPGTTAAMVRKVMKDLAEACRAAGLALCGGHTEITDAVTRPVVSAHVAGTVARGRLIDRRSVKTGDRVVLTKRVAVEGTSILARDFAAELREAGVSQAELERCRRFLEKPGISVLPEARLAADSGAASAMHDVTEGGLATALEELGTALGGGILVWPHRIPVYEETRALCGSLGLDPLGLIGSGSLIIVCRAGCEETLLRALHEEGIEATLIGEVLEPGGSVQARDEAGNPAPWPRFEVDELARLLACRALRI